MELDSHQSDIDLIIVIFAQCLHGLADIVVFCVAEVVVNIELLIRINDFLDEVLDIQFCTRIYDGFYLFQYLLHGHPMPRVYLLLE